MVTVICTYRRTEKHELVGPSMPEIQKHILLKEDVPVSNSYSKYFKLIPWHNFYWQKYVLIWIKPVA